ncbi:MAG: glycosyl hydrolase, partial [Gammaproteobacteria bacterium]|nr:glycosyl hydrolase [Gammaproteobacteria bacterium]
MSAKLNKVLPSCLLAAGLCIATAPGTSAHAEDVRPELRIQPAEHVAAANQEMMLSAALAGKRIVAVGNRGVVLLSDDDGKTYRQARTVPVSTSLTGVWFADAQVGWAVGHWGAILKTSDGGETWNIQRSDITVDQPLFSVYFESPSVGWAA